MDRDEHERHLRAILDNPGTGARITEAKLRAIGELQRLDGALDVPDGSVLTPRQRAALKDAIVWGFSPVLWDHEQRQLVLALGLWSEAELQAEVEASRPRRTRRR